MQALNGNDPKPIVRSREVFQFVEDMQRLLLVWQSVNAPADPLASDVAEIQNLSSETTMRSQSITNYLVEFLVTTILALRATRIF
jgi:hypothetical protein